MYFSEFSITACLACGNLLYDVVHCNLNEYSIDKRNVKTKMAVWDIPKWRKRSRPYPQISVNEKQDTGGGGVEGDSSH